MELVAIPSEKWETLQASVNEIKAMLAGAKLEILPKQNSGIWLSKKETCRRLQVCSKTLEGYLSKRLIPYSQHGRKIYTKDEDIDNFLNERYVKKRK